MARIECGICHEFIAKDERTLAESIQVQMGHIAEMYDPRRPEAESAIVHTECGLAAGWEVS